MHIKKGHLKKIYGEVCTEKERGLTERAIKNPKKTGDCMYKIEHMEMLREKTRVGNER